MELDQRVKPRETKRKKLECAEDCLGILFGKKLTLGADGRVSFKGFASLI